MISKLIEKKTLKQLECIQKGTLSITTPKGKTYQFEGKDPGFQGDIEIRDWRVMRYLANRGDVGLAETFREGLWHTSDLASLLTFGLENHNVIEVNGGWVFSQFSKLLYLLRLNTLKGSKRNIQEHYDLGNDFYSLWLDDSMSYSSAIFKHQDESLVSAQMNKYDRLLNMLQSNSGRLLEIGCGWGGLAERALGSGDFALKGVTLSEEQLLYAKNRVPGADFVLEDYRIQKGAYDHIVSIEMFEAVGVKYWKTYFAQLKSLLSKNGTAAIQTITIADELADIYRRTPNMIRTFIFPGGMLPSKSQLLKLTEEAGLRCRSLAGFGKDYELTLRHWLKNFDVNLPKIKAMGYDEPFIRLWRFYLAGCIATFRTARTDVLQLELSHA